jgi:TolB protein
MRLPPGSTHAWRREPKPSTVVGLGVAGLLLAALVAWWLLAGSVGPLPAPRPAATRVTAAHGGPPLLGIPDLITTPAGAPAAALAELLGSVLRDDLAYSTEFVIVPAADAALVPVARTPDRVPFAAWKTAGADGVSYIHLQTDGASVRVGLRLFAVRTGELAFEREYTATEADVRALAHRAADDILASQTGIHGVAETRLAFVSDRQGAKRALTGELRRVKEIFVSDYDGADQKPVTFDGDLALTPNWSPDGRAVAYTSYRRGYQDVFIAWPGEGRLDNPTHGVGKNWLPSWSPDGTRLAFTSSRGGAESLYVMNADGTDIHRIGSGGGIDTSPSWSPDGKQIAFTSNRTGSPQIWIAAADGSNARALTTEKYCDRPAWSPGPFDEIAYVSKTSTGFDIKVIDVATGRQRQLTAGQGFNESPAWAPNGRHLAFSSTRSGSEQVWTMTRTGMDLRQVTRVGNNSMPSWGKEVGSDERQSGLAHVSRSKD